MIVAPVTGASLLHVLTDDTDAERRVAQERVDVALQRLRHAGVRAEGRVDMGQPMRALLDGLREFPATEIVLLRGGEEGWRKAEQLSDKIHTRLGLPVTEVGVATEV